MEIPDKQVSALTKQLQDNPTENRVQRQIGTGYHQKGGRKVEYGIFLMIAEWDENGRNPSVEDRLNECYKLTGRFPTFDFLPDKCIMRIGKTDNVVFRTEGATWQEALQIGMPTLKDLLRKHGFHEQLKKEYGLPQPKSQAKLSLR